MHVLIVAPLPLEATCPVGAVSQTFADALAMLQDPSLAGLVVELRMLSGTFDNATSGELGGSARTLGAAIVASEVRVTSHESVPTRRELVAEGAADAAGVDRAPVVIRAADESGVSILTIEAGAPPLAFDGISLENSRGAAAVTINGGVVDIRACAFRHNRAAALLVSGTGRVAVHDSDFTNNGHAAAQGGAVQVAGGQVDIDHSTFTGNSAAQGGAIHATGLATRVTLVASTLKQNVAASVGGALYVDGCAATMGNKTALHDNHAPLGKSAYVANGASVSYSLPTPKGSWVSATHCKLYRAACPPSASACDPEAQPALSTQPCDASEYGQHLSRLSSGPVDDALPYRCPPGTVGSSDAARDQSSSQCSGACVREADLNPARGGWIGRMEASVPLMATRSSPVPASLSGITALREALRPLSACVHGI